jgi:uncharacterized protein (TIGR03382 family)
MRTIGYVLTAALGASLVPASALACGGFFCSSVPVDQSKERILFWVDDDLKTIEAHIQIFYQGSAESFAWVLPVASEPELFVSTDQLFTQLDWQTRPYFWLNYKEEGTCEWDYWYGGMEDADCGGGFCAPSAGAGGGGDRVEVISEAQVGPYETVVLRASSSDLLLDWLQENGYDLPDTLSPALSPYVASSSYFVALRLANDKDVGDIAPIGLRYTGDRANIPIQLTSIAATPDMRLEVYVAGPARAVPDNYLHVTINEAAIDWLGGGGNYDDVITLAADEAGGQAFATDFAGPVTGVSGVYTPGQFNTSLLRDTADPVEFLNQLLWQGFPRNGAMQNLLRVHIPMPQAAVDAGVTEQAFYNCLSCNAQYLEGFVFDPNAFVDDLEAIIIDPLIRAQRVFDSSQYISRLTSSISPVEMTVDPVFVFNGDMGDVPNYRRADLVFICGDGTPISEAPRRIDLADGRSILLPAQEWFDTYGVSQSEFLDALGTPAAATIEDTDESGAPVVLVDNSAEMRRLTQQHNDRVRGMYGDDGGCACGSSGSPLLWPVGLAALLAGVSRRRRAL